MEGNDVPPVDQAADTIVRMIGNDLEPKKFKTILDMNGIEYAFDGIRVEIDEAGNVTGVSVSRRSKSSRR